MSLAPKTQDTCAALSDSGAFPHKVGVVERRETHCSVVFLAGAHAYKLKKPVRLPFLDYSSVTLRREACREEVRLNRRLASGVYLGVASVIDHAGAVRVVEADRDDALDYLVWMRRYDERLTLAAMVESDRVTPADLPALARRLAHFHAEAPAAPRAEWSQGFANRLRETCDTLSACGESAVRTRAASRFASAFLRAHADSVRAREVMGLVREVHGDLRAEHVLFEDPIQIVDCIEFDRAFRTLDVAADLAFLVMDLLSLGRADLAQELCRRYREAGGDPGSDQLLAFYGADRALVRAKVARLRAEQLDEVNARGERLAEADALMRLAERLRWQARAPVVACVAGVAASGKSTLAHELAARAHLPHLSSDVVRKRAAGVAPDEPAPPESYATEVTAAVYSELGRLASEGLRAHGGVIVDATFHQRWQRERFLVELPSGAPSPLFIECQIDAAEALERAHRRVTEGPHISDAGPQVVGDQLRDAEDFSELEPLGHAAIRCDVPLDDEVEAVERAFDARLATSP